MARLRNDDLFAINRDDKVYKISTNDVIISLLPELISTPIVFPVDCFVYDTLECRPEVVGGKPPYSISYAWKYKTADDDTLRTPSGITDSNVYYLDKSSEGRMFACEVTVTDDVSNEITNLSNFTSTSRYRNLPPIIDKVELFETNTSDPRYTDQVFKTDLTMIGDTPKSAKGIKVYIDGNVYYTLVTANVNYSFSAGSSDNPQGNVQLGFTDDTDLSDFQIGDLVIQDDSGMQGVINSIDLQLNRLYITYTGVAPTGRGFEAFSGGLSKNFTCQETLLLSFWFKSGGRTKPTGQQTCTYMFFNDPSTGNNIVTQPYINFSGEKGALSIDMNVNSSPRPGIDGVYDSIANANEWNHFLIWYDNGAANRTRNWNLWVNGEDLKGGTAPTAANVENSSYFRAVFDPGTKGINFDVLRNYSFDPCCFFDYYIVPDVAKPTDASWFITGTGAGNCQPRPFANVNSDIQNNGGWNGDGATYLPFDKNFTPTDGSDPEKYLGFNIISGNYDWQVATYGLDLGYAAKYFDPETDPTGLNWKFDSPLRLDGRRQLTPGRLYGVIDADGNITGFERVDTGYQASNFADGDPLVFNIKMPSQNRTLQTPDQDFPPGTQISVDVRCINLLGDDTMTSNIVTPGTVTSTFNLPDQVQTEQEIYDAYLVDKRSSATAKLIALGLDMDEIKVLNLDHTGN